MRLATLALGLITALVIVAGCISDNGPPLKIPPSIHPTVPPEETVMGRLYNDGQPVTSSIYNNGSIYPMALSLVQNRTRTYNASGYNVTYWENDEATLSVPYGDNRYSFGDAFSSGYFIQGQPVWFRIERWNATTHAFDRYESNRQYVYAGQEIDLDLAKDMHLVVPPYPADSSGNLPTPQPTIIK